MTSTVPPREGSQVLGRDFRPFSRATLPLPDPYTGVRGRSRGPTDGSSNAYPSGSHRVSGKEVHEFSPGIDTAWVRHFACGLAPCDDYVQDFVVDRDGNIYVTGSTATVKYDARGNLRWAAKCVDDRYGRFLPSEIAVEDSDGVFVAGFSFLAGEYHLILVKYGIEGDVKWSVEIDDAQPSGVAVFPSVLIQPDGSGNVFLATLRSDPVAQGTSATALRKFDATGALEWAALDSLYAARDMECDDAGNLFFLSTGSGSDAVVRWEWFLTKFAADGRKIWTTRDSLGVYAVGLARDEKGNIYVTGSSTGEVYMYVPGRSATAKYDSAGSRQWVNTYDSLDSAGVTMRVPRWLGVVMSRGLCKSCWMILPVGVQ